MLAALAPHGHAALSRGLVAYADINPHAIGL
jgi:hypothetical protein